MRAQPRPGQARTGDCRGATGSSSRVAAVSAKLLDVYAEDGMSLEQLMAFTVTTDHVRQEKIWDALQHSHSQEPYQIRRMLTERTVRASDKRAAFVGLAAYEQGGGVVMRD